MSLSPALQSSSRARRVVLTGFMGSGKTTVGRLLAEQLGWQFVDLDAWIVQRAGTNVAAIFAEQGEAAFRVLEADVLTDALQLDDAVIALGGGTTASEANRRAISAAIDTKVVYLSAPLATLYARCEQAAADGAAVRPLLQNLDAASERFADREPHYVSVAHASVDTTAHAPHEIAAHILTLIAE